ncbi:RES family NAD+ phosphorylase [Caulobacter sp. BK020]|uniref:RES family NAD+ phosphorylase n=1 Tax=Caulobacter sp. BK020 TaxID=2512117 RepID=UPI0010F2EA76|nr:RES family NAD+ phosphorylase [Caulobacter sp. BK020]TCS15290.1 RES domain-containing protein [Caulobacter sp. BK020]
MAKVWDEISGRFYRVLFEADRSVVLDGAKSPEGRFHHDGQPALYLSPSAEWAARAIDVYRRAGDPPRSTVPLKVDRAKIVDLRKASHCAALSINAEDAAIPWRPQRSRGDRADSWKLAEVVRASDADGMIYTARSARERWHLVLFRWNGSGGPTVAVTDLPAID